MPLRQHRLSEVFTNLLLMDGLPGLECFWRVFSRFDCVALALSYISVKAGAFRYRCASSMSALIIAANLDASGCVRIPNAPFC